MQDSRITSINQLLETKSREMPHLSPFDFSLPGFDGNVIAGIHIRNGMGWKFLSIEILR